MSIKHARGFTLIEVVVAFAILSLVLTAVFSSLEMALSRSAHNQRLIEATLLAQSLLARAGSEWPMSRGPLMGSWNSYRYELTQEAAGYRRDRSPLAARLIRVTATVPWPESRGSREISLATLKLEATSPP